MRNIFPSMMPLDSRYLSELKRVQDLFLASITESDEETAYRNACHEAWVKSTFKPRDIGSSN